MNINKKTERLLEDVQIKLSALWVALMFIYCVGSVILIFAGDITVGEISGIESTEIMWLGVAVLMVIPAAMAVLSLTSSMSRVANLTAAIIFLILHLIGLLEYTSPYNTFLIIVGLMVNLIILSYTRKLTSAERRRHT